MKSSSSPNNRADSNPVSQWIDEPTSTILTINLPGFTKEQLKITFDESNRSLTVRGERRLPNNGFSRDFKIPHNCNLNEMKAKFDQNSHILTITMPKKTPSPQAIVELPKKTNHEEQKKEALSTQDTYPLPNPPKPNGNNTIIGKQNVEKEEEKTSASSQPPNRSLPESQKDVPDPQTKEKVKAGTGKATANRDETITGASQRISSEAGMGSLLEKTSPVAKKVGMGDEEKRVLVNAGVAVLVIAALGLYIYKFGSYGKPTKD